MPKEPVRPGAIVLLAAILIGFSFSGLSCESKKPESARPADEEGASSNEGSRNGQPQDQRDEMPSRNVGMRVDSDAVAPMQYLQLTVRSMDLGKRIKAMGNLRSVGTALRIYAATNGKMPETLEQLVKQGMISKDAIVSPVKQGGPYAYIAGPSPSAPGENVVVYDSKVLYAGKAVMLRMSGAAEAVDPAVLEKAVAETRELIGE